MLSYVFLDVDNIFKDDIKKELKSFDFTVDEVKEISGKYNILARVVTDNRFRLHKFIYDNIHNLTGVKKIKTFKVI